jgi:hypothetical protein
MAAAHKSQPLRVSPVIIELAPSRFFVQLYNSPTALYTPRGRLHFKVTETLAIHPAYVAHTSSGVKSISPLRYIIRVVRTFETLYTVL